MSKVYCSVYERCPNCRVQLPVAAKVCFNCGTKVCAGCG